MSERPPTLLIVYLRPDHDEVARYHIDDALTAASLAYHLITQQEERNSLENTTPFVIIHHQWRMAFALHVPLDPKAIEDIAQMVMVGLILGFVVKDEIALGQESPEKNCS